MASRKHPSGTEKRQLGAVMTFRLLPEEREKIEARAGDKELELGSYIRSVLVKDSKIRSRRKAGPDVKALIRLTAIISKRADEITGAVNKVGSNINQIAHVLNAGGRPVPAALDVAAAALLEIKKEAAASLIEIKREAQKVLRG